MSGRGKRSPTCVRGSRRDKFIDGLSLGLGLAFCSVALNGLTDHLLFNIPSSMLLWMLAAMTAAVHAIAEERKKG